MKKSLVLAMAMALGVTASAYAAWRRHLPRRSSDDPL